MIKEVELIIYPKFINDSDYQKNFLAKKIGINPEEIKFVKVLRRSIDARQRLPFYKVRFSVYVNEYPSNDEQQFKHRNVSKSKSAIIIGSGPSGLFAALKLIECGIKPIIFERGNDVRKRRIDLKNIQQYGIVNPDSNYCFGEGGAGTYSDGKLYTRATKRGDVSRILSLFVQFGAEPDIEIDAHPHIGSNKLPKIVQNMRNAILECGGEFHFNSRLTDIKIINQKIHSVIINDSKEYPTKVLLIATGHSARDIYYLLNKNGVRLERKEFAVGVRIEHPQQLIDEIQYHSSKRDKNLPASSYNISCQIDNRGVYSFCMCPGGIIVPASTSPGELVLNGMSVSRRDSPFANSGLVTTVDESNLVNFLSHDVFAGIEYQKSIEKKCYENANGSQRAPAQRVTDFVNNITSSTLSKTSYIPGIFSAPLHEILPKEIVLRLQKSLFEFDRKMKGYLTEEAQILAPETRTSSPIRIPRNKETFMHVDIEGLFPVGEGAGYAGGIVSAAIDGENCAMHISKYLSRISI